MTQGWLAILLHRRRLLCVKESRGDWGFCWASTLDGTNYCHGVVLKACLIQAEIDDHQADFSQDIFTEVDVSNSQRDSARFPEISREIPEVQFRAIIFSLLFHYFSFFFRKSNEE